VVAVGSEHPVDGSVLRSLPVPLQQVGGDVYVDGNRLLRDLGLTPSRVLIHHSSTYVDLRVQKVDVGPFRTCQLARKNQDPLPQKNGRDHFLHLLNGENVGNGHPLGA
jgi:hypothetical protein